MSQPTKYQFMSHRSEGVRLKDDRELGSYSDIDGLPGDAAETDVTKSATRMAWLKGLVSLIKGVLGVGGDSLNVTVKGSNVRFTPYPSFSLAVGATWWNEPPVFTQGYARVGIGVVQSGPARKIQASVDWYDNDTDWNWYHEDMIDDGTVARFSHGADLPVMAPMVQIAVTNKDTVPVANITVGFSSRS